MLVLVEELREITVLLIWYRGPGSRFLGQCLITSKGKGVRHRIQGLGLSVEGRARHQAQPLELDEALNPDIFGLS